MAGHRRWLCAPAGFLFFGGVLLCIAPLPAQTTGNRTSDADGALRGHVYDVRGLPVPRASVTVLSTLTGHRRAQITGDSGGFLFEDLPGGRYSLAAAAAGLASETRVVEIGRGTKPFTVELRLPPAVMRQEVTVVSGSRVEELQTESPVRVEAVTRAEMQDTGYERVSDILSEVPGVVIRSGSTATVGAEQVEGIDSRQVLVLQDGLPVVGARGIKSGIVNLHRQDVGKLERVEVAKGAASALYGTDAIGGVINMITREPSDPFQFGASLSGGSLGALDGRADFGSRWKKLTVFGDLETHRQDAYGLIPGDRSTVGPDYERNDILTKFGYALHERARFGFTATAYHNHQTGLTSSTSGFTLGTSNDSMQSYAATGDFTVTNSTTVQARAYAARYDENARTNYVDTPGPAFGLANLNERYHRLDTTISQQIGGRQLLQGGVEWVQDLYRGANRLVGDNVGRQVTTSDVWLQDRLEPWRNVTLTLGGRLQHHSLYGDHVVPKVGLVVRLSDHLVFRGSFGKGFRAPDLGQLYYRFANPSSFYQVIGNPTLRPESSASFSAGASYQRRRYGFGVHLFRHNLNNLIDSYSVGMPQTPEQMEALLAPYGVPLTFNPLLNRLTFIYLNLNRARTEGFELSGNVALTSEVRLQSAYTYVYGVDRATGLLLPQRHRHQGFVKAEYSKPRWGMLANIRGVFFSKWPLNPAAGTYGYGYRIWDLYASKHLRRGFQAFGSIDNLADSTDRKLDAGTPGFDRPDYGRTFRLGLRYAFSRENN